MAQLQDGNEIYRLMVERTLDCAIFMLDADGRIITWNGGAEQIEGYRASEVMGRHVSFLYPGGDARAGKPERDLLTAAARGRFEEESWRVRNDGSRFWAHVAVNAIRDETGELLGFVKLIRDLSEQRRAQDELRRSEERFHSAMESAPNAMIMVNRGGRIEMLNLQAEVVFGYSRDELLGEPIEMLIPERFRRVHPGDRMTFFADPKARPMGAGRDLYALKKDGSEFPVEIGLSPIETEEGLMVLASIIDITDRKRKEEQLRRGQERFCQVVEGSPNAIVLVGRDGRIEMVNERTERLFGYPRAELLGKPVEVLVPERFRQDHPGLRADFVANPSSRPMGAGRDLHALKKNGSEFPVEIALNPIETEDGLSVIAAIADITGRKQKEEAIQAALREREVLLAEIHHRVNNNLQIVQSILRLQSAKTGDPEIREMLMDCQNRIKSMALIHQALYPSADLAKVDFASFLNSLALSLINSYRIDTGRIALLIEAEPVLLPVGIAVPCGQIANELLTNAIKHAFPDGRQGTIGVALNCSNGEAVVSVTDNGVGIPASVDTRSPASMGLRLVNLLTSQLEGRLSVRRANPTRFTLEFPAPDAITVDQQARVSSRSPVHQWAERE
jgi:PAS domain S-box-containing protein